METVTLNGTEYVKASVLAKKLGYTSDYLGQLCRGGKVDAELVGRSWYVEPNSVTEHKKNRYGGATKNITPSARRAVRTPKGETHIAIHSYEDDAHDLIPHIQRYAAKKSGAQATTHVQVKKQEREPILKDAEPIKVTSKSRVTRLQAGDRPKVTFKGSLPVLDITDDEIAADEIVADGPSEEPTDTSVSASVKTRSTIAKTDSVKTVRADSVEQITITTSTNKPGFTLRFSMTTVMVTACVLVLVCASFISLEREVTATAEGNTTNLSLDFSRTASVLKSVVK